KMDGVDRINTIAVATAMTGAIHIDLTDAASAVADGFHSRSDRCVTSIRHAVRAIASRLTVASYGRNARVSVTCAACRAATLAIASKCCRSRTSAGLRSRSMTNALAAGSTRTEITASVHSQAGESSVHPNSSSEVKAAG